MPARIVVDGTTFKGRTIDTVIRTNFGPKAFLQRFADPNAPGMGQVLVPAPHGGFLVQGTVSYAEEFKRVRHLSRQQRWDNACGKMRAAMEDVESMADELQAQDEEDLTKEEREQQERDFQERLDADNSDFSSGLQELRDLRDEYQEWYDNLPENLQYDSPVAEKLQAVIDLYTLDNDVEFTMEGDEVEGVYDATDILDEAENADLPRGFGRD